MGAAEAGGAVAPVAALAARHRHAKVSEVEARTVRSTGNGRLSCFGGGRVPRLALTTIQRERGSKLAGPQDSIVTPRSWSPENQAREAFERGRIHYDNGDFARAAGAFEEAYKLSGREGLLYNLYLAYRDANEQENLFRAVK